MKILYHHRTRSKDGQDVHITAMIAALRRLGHEVVVVAPPAADAASFGDDGGGVALLKRVCPRFVYELAEYAYAFVAYRRLARAIADHRPDVIYERYNLYLPAGVWASRRFGLPLLLEVNAPLFDERNANGEIALPRLARASERKTWRGADCVLPVTGVLAGIVQREGVDPKRIVVIPNGIDPRQFGATLDAADAKRRVGLEGRTVLGFTGFVREWHGLDRVVALLASDAARTAPEPWHLLVVGDGPARAKLEQQAAALGVSDRVTFAGLVGRAEIPQHIAAFDIALQPAAVPYASPLKLFEYMALGRAIVAPAQPNIAEVLTDGDDALLFDPLDDGALGAAIGRLAADPALRDRLGANAMETIRTRRLTWDDNAARVVELFESLQRSAPAGHVATTRFETRNAQ